MITATENASGEGIALPFGEHWFASDSSWGSSYRILILKNDDNLFKMFIFINE